VVDASGCQFFFGRTQSLRGCERCARYFKGRVQYGKVALYTQQADVGLGAHICINILSRYRTSYSRRSHG